MSRLNPAFFISIKYAEPCPWIIAAPLYNQKRRLVFVCIPHPLLWWVAALIGYDNQIANAYFIILLLAHLPLPKSNALYK